MLGLLQGLLKINPKWNKRTNIWKKTPENYLLQVTNMLIITIISVLITTSKCDSFQPLQDDKTCQDMTLSEYHQMNFNLCTGNENGHCLMNEQRIPGFVCLQVEEIPKGKNTWMYKSKEEKFKHFCMALEFL